GNRSWPALPGLLSPPVWQRSIQRSSCLSLSTCCFPRSARWRSHSMDSGASELAVVAFLESLIEVGRGVHLPVVLDLLVTPGLDHAAVFELEAVGGIGQILLLDQYALEGFRVETGGGAAFQSLVVGVQIDRLEVRTGIIRRHDGGLGKRGVDP